MADTTPPIKSKPILLRAKFYKRLMIFLLVIVVGCGVAYYVLPNETKRQVYETLGIEDSNFVKSKGLESYVVIRNMTSRKALLGDSWVIKGAIFNTHETAIVKKVKLMFNFSDGVETVTLGETIPPKNSVGKKFKEKITGHNDADFLSVEVLDAE